MTDEAVAALARSIASLLTLNPEDRALRARRLVDQAKTVLSAEADAATAELAKTTSYKEAAYLLGVSESMINKAVTRHRQRSAS